HRFESNADGSAVTQVSRSGRGFAICSFYKNRHRVGPGDIFASATRIAPALHSERANSSTAIREAETHYPSLQIRGFGDVDFSATNQKGSVSGFNLGQFVLHLASPLSKKVGHFGELSFTARPTGYDVQVERTIIQYDYNDYFLRQISHAARLLEYKHAAWQCLLMLAGGG
ncbi:MAG: hypothetical protein DMG85_18630, partial [Acidobacteria bacterium]